MAATSAPSLPYPASPSIASSSSPPLKTLKKVFSSKSRRSSEAQADTDHAHRSSIDSLTLDRTSTLPSSRSSPSRDSAKSSSGVRKLIPGHGKRQRKRLKEEEIRASIADIRGRKSEAAARDPPAAATFNRSNSSLLTDITDYDTPPPLVSRDSHNGYFTISSPMITTKTVVDGHARNARDTALLNGGAASGSNDTFPTLIEPDDTDDNTTNNSRPSSTRESTSSLPLPGLIDKADTLKVEEPRDRRSSFSRLRAKSPARKFKDVFSKPGRSPRASPERSATNSQDNVKTLSLAERRLADNADMDVPPPLDPITCDKLGDDTAQKKLPSLNTVVPPPKTPPSARLSTPLTTVTPPTPTETGPHLTQSSLSLSSQQQQDSKPDDGENPDIVVSASGNMISHRRTRSASAANHGKSKLSVSSVPPLTPTIEEDRTPVEKSVGNRNATPGGGFFSSWVSVAQTAATSLTAFGGQNRSRSTTTNSEPTKIKPIEDHGPESSSDLEKEIDQKKLAVETLGSGDLNFSHLGLDSAFDETSLGTKPGNVNGLRQNSHLRREEADAKVEDILAKRAVSAAYEKNGGDTTPIAEINDPVATLRPSQTFDSNTMSGNLNTPSGSVFEAEAGLPKRSGSVRSKLASRRSRGSSIATGHSALGAIIGASTATLANPTANVKPAFNPAPKARNRTFHQQFRSVPEDDNLIEDYSCALQREILLAGRIYISEGHICFSSNILGWVTTLIISFEEIVSIERENTAMIIPNAIAIQTLHARNTFRSLLSREATFELIINIWRQNHPASFQKSVNGKQILAEQAQDAAKDAVGTNEDDAQASDASSENDSDSGDDDDDDGDSVHSLDDSPGSEAGSDFIDAKSVMRKPSGTNGPSLPSTNAVPGVPAGEVGTAAALIAGIPPAAVDYPGPAAHAPTDCTESSTHYDIVIKDEIIPAPLGKIYSLLYGPQSGVFVRNYLVDEGKSQELVLEDDKKGLNNENKTRSYSYIKPLGGPIGPKQTRCMTTEVLDFFDLEKSVSVTCSTQTPDVPSGSSFSTKTRYCLSWAPGNATRLQMTCTIEWTAKSWLKTAIERGAKDGQQQYGDGLVKALRGAIGRARAMTSGSKGPKGKKRRRSEKKDKSEKVERSTAAAKDWGPLESVRSTLEPVTGMLEPFARMEVLVGILTIMVLILWFRGGSPGNQMAFPHAGRLRADRLAAYEEMWQREESELWDWLENRAGINQVILHGRDSDSAEYAGRHKQRGQDRQRTLKSKDMAAKLRAEKWSQKEMHDAVRMTRQRLDEMQRAIENEATQTGEA